MSVNAESTQQGLFINGKAQVIEMLKFMQPEEREVLLRNIKARNPQLAMELTENCLTFSDLNRLGDDELHLIFNYVKPAIWGLALKDTPRDFQRRVLGLAERDYAEQAYQVLTTTLKNEERDTKRAQQKIVSILGNLLKRRQITI
ncbi:MAG: flagellar motor switch protein FliG [Bacteriovoracaceae bacterium]|jgi:flagellar motor switch protein FliG